jgi:hypothetical protein
MQTQLRVPSPPKKSVHVFRKSGIETICTSFSGASLLRTHVQEVREVGIEVLLVSSLEDSLYLLKELAVRWARTLEDALVKSK